MTRTVWKFPLKFHYWNDIEVGATEDRTTSVVHVGIDPATRLPAVWIECDPSGKPMARSFTIVGTGHDIPSGENVDPVEHVGSVIDSLGFVWHVYERTLFFGEPA